MLKSNFEGTTRIFRKEEEGWIRYSTQLSQKNINGEWENTYVDVQLPKGTDLENKTDINISKSFLSWYKTQKGFIRFKIVVMDYTVVEGTQEPFNNAAPVDDLDQLPF